MKSFGKLTLVLLLAFPAPGRGEAPRSEATAECLGRHESISPGIMGDWETSRHARVTPADALAVSGEKSRFSAKQAPTGMAQTSVGCAECHTARPEKHAGSFDHNGFEVHAAVSEMDEWLKTQKLLDRIPEKPVPREPD